MKTRILIALALTALLPLAVSANGLEALAEKADAPQAKAPVTAETKAEVTEAKSPETAEAAKAEAAADAEARPAKKRKLAPAGDQPDVTETTGSAEPKKEKKSLSGRAAVITADRTDYDRKEGVILFDRNVYVDDEQFQMHAERLFVFLDGTNDLKRLVAIGNVAITNDAKAAGCSRAVYTKAGARVVLYGDEQKPAWLRDAGGRKGDASEVRGRRITYWFDSETATVEGAVIEMPGIKGGAKDIFDGPAGKKAGHRHSDDKKAE